MRYIGLLVLFYLLSCKEGPEQRTRFQHTDFQATVLVDTFSNKLSRQDFSSLTESGFHPMYIGPIKDSLWLNYNSDLVNYRSKDWESYRSPKTGELEIIIDTSQIIGNVNRIYRLPPPKNKTARDTLFDYIARLPNRGDIMSYPVLIKNLSKDTLRFGYGEHLPIIMEAKDSTGSWRPIQQRYRYFCGTGLTIFFIPPREIAISSNVLFKGDFETSLRLAYGFDGAIKSHSFEGRINYDQFEGPVLYR